MVAKYLLAVQVHAHTTLHADLQHVAHQRRHVHGKRLHVHHRLEVLRATLRRGEGARLLHLPLLVHGIDRLVPECRRLLTVHGVVPRRLAREQRAGDEGELHVGEAGVEVAGVHQHAVDLEGEVRGEEARVLLVDELQRVQARRHAEEEVERGRL